MASETEQSTDDILSLEDLVRDTSPPATPIAESVAAIDEVLSVEDPGFASELQALKDAGASPEAGANVAVDSDVDQILQKEKVEKASKGIKKLRLLLFVRPWRKLVKLLSTVKALAQWLKLTALPATKAGALGAVGGLKSAVSWLIGKVQTGLTRFGKQPTQSKLLIIAVMGLCVAAASVTRIAIHGSFLPALKKEFVYSFAEGADQSYTFDSEGKWQDLNDPLLHPEHIVLLERLIVNLRSPGDDSNPMALLDIYVEAGSQDAAVEIKDRDAEVRDMVLRTMEQMAYEELVTESGKNKLKVFLRKNLNEMLSRGRVRRLYFKSIVLKP